jgi:uncharacterized protein YkwD
MGVGVGAVALGPAVSADAPRSERKVAHAALSGGSTAEGASVARSGTGSAAKASARARYQRQAHRTTNARRDDAGLDALGKGDCVQRFAVRWARTMAAETRMYHQDLGPILESCGLTGVGENVAYGYSSGRAVVNVGWMHSPGHRENILNPGWRVMGIGARQGVDGLWYVSQVFGTAG